MVTKSNNTAIYTCTCDAICCLMSDHWAAALRLSGLLEMFRCRCDGAREACKNFRSCPSLVKDSRALTEEPLIITTETNCLGNLHSRTSSFTCHYASTLNISLSPDKGYQALVTACCIALHTEAALQNTRYTIEIAIIKGPACGRNARARVPAYLDFFFCSLRW